MRAAMMTGRPKMIGGGGTKSAGLSVVRPTAAPEPRIEVIPVRAQPAGQADMTISLDDIWGYNPSGVAGITPSTPPAEAAAAVKDKLGGAAEQSGKPAPVTGLSDQALGGLFTGLGNFLGQSAQAIAATIASGNQVVIARIQAETARYIAQLQAQGRYQDAQNAQLLQTSLSNQAPYIAPPPASTWSNTGIALAVGGGVLLVGALVLLAMNMRRRKNPVISNGRRRFFAQPDVAADYLEREGYAIVGKSSSTRRRRRRRAA